MACPAGTRYEVNDPGLAEAVGKLLTQERLDDVKLLMKTSLLATKAGTLSHDFIEAINTYDQELLGSRLCRMRISPLRS